MPAWNRDLDLVKSPATHTCGTEMSDHLGTETKAQRERDYLDEEMTPDDEEAQQALIEDEEMRLMKECVAKLSDGERAALVEEFRLFDKDKSGFITRKELSSVLRDLGVYKTTEAEEHGVEAMFKMFDKSNDNRIDEEEFLGMMAISMKLPMTEDQLTEAFRAFDADGSGTVDGTELKKALGNLGPKFLSDEECDELMALVDQDQDGTLVVEEFVSFFLKSDLGKSDVLDEGETPMSADGASASALAAPAPLTAAVPVKPAE